MNVLKEISGAARGIRTPDPIITNDVLYQLSYCGDGVVNSGIGPPWQARTERSDARGCAIGGEAGQMAPGPGAVAARLAAGMPSAQARGAETAPRVTGRRGGLGAKNDIGSAVARPRSCRSAKASGPQ